MGWWKRRSGALKTLIVCWSLAVVVVIIGIGLAAFSSDDGTVTAASLNKSVQYEYDWEHDVVNPHCKRLSSHRWRCGVTDNSSGKRVGYYAVKTYGGSNWWARREDSGSSDFSQSARIMSSYVDKDEAGEESNGAVFVLLLLIWLALAAAPLFVWLTVRFREPPPVELVPRRPVGPTPEKPGT